MVHSRVVSVSLCAVLALVVSAQTVAPEKRMRLKRPRKETWVRKTSAPRVATAVDLFQEKTFVSAQPTRAERRFGATRSRRGQVRPEALELNPSGKGRVILNLFDDVTLEAELTEVVRNGDAVTRYGQIVGHDRSRAAITTYRGAVIGVVRFIGTGYGYSFRCSPAKSCLIHKLDFTRMPSEEGAAEGPDRKEKGDRISITATAARIATVDVLVLYTPGALDEAAKAELRSEDAAAKREAIVTMEAEIAIAVTDANESYAASGIFLKVNAVHTELVAYRHTDVEESSVILQALRGGEVANAQQLREKWRADMVVMIVGPMEGCGICALQEVVTTGFEERAYCVVAFGCLPKFTFAHELGHAMGANHDWYMDEEDNSVFPFNHGFSNTSKGWRTMMAYPDECDYGSRLGDNENEDDFGRSVAVGDFDNDGKMDIAVGAPGEAPGPDPASGAVFVYEGTEEGPLAVGSVLQEAGNVGSNEAGDNFGLALATGDFDGDGFADLAVGTPGERPGDDPKSGAVYVFRGSPSGLTDNSVLTQETGNLGTNETGDEYGTSLAVGNFNGDGFADLVVGAPGDRPDGDRKAGAVFVYLGSRLGLTPYKSLTQEAGGRGDNEAGDEFGAALAAGDFNGDKQTDLAVGAPGESPDGDRKAGTVFVFHGVSSGLTPAPSLTQEAGDVGDNESGDEFGAALAAGDFNGDHKADLAVGAPGESPGDDPKSGTVFLFKGSESGLTADTSLTQETGADLGANEAGDEFGAALVAADFDDDGDADLAVGAPGDEPSGDPNSGFVFVYKGSTNGLTPAQGISQATEDDGRGTNDSGDRFGVALAAADIDGDGFPDLIVGVPNETAVDNLPDAPGRSAGAFYFFRGDDDRSQVLTDDGSERRSQTDPTAPCDRENIWSNPDLKLDGEVTGRSLTSAQPTDNRRVLNETAFTVANFRPFVVCYVNDNCALTQNHLAAASNEAGDKMGAAVAAGDFNHDGKMDLAVGAPGAAPGNDPSSGIVYVFNGAAMGLLQGEGLTEETGNLGENEAGDEFGAALAVGDFNRDGFADLAVGAPREKPGDDPRSGAVYIFKGSPGGLMAGQVLTEEIGGLGTNESGDEFGTALAAGDFNGDGYADLAVGAPGEKPGDDPKAGTVFVFKGSPAGLIAAASLTEETGSLGTNESGDEFGAALAAGDFNGDRKADLAVGAPGEKPGDDPKAGTVFVFKGSPAGLIADKSLTQETGDLGANESGDEFGAALAAADFNGDQHADLAVGAPGEKPGDDPKAGTVFVFDGSPSGLKAGKSLTQAGLGDNETGDEFGATLTAGDFSGDGRADLAVGAPGEKPGGDSKSGAVYLFKSVFGRLIADVAISQTSGAVGTNEAGDEFGTALAAGDFNGDGKIDLAIGAPGEAPGSEPKSGVAYVFTGR